MLLTLSFNRNLYKIIILNVFNSKNFNLNIVLIFHLFFIFLLVHLLPRASAEKFKGGGKAEKLHH